MFGRLFLEFSIERFKLSFKECQELSFSLDQELRLTWKLHIIFNHIIPFCQHHNSVLGIYAEQTGESIHCKFKATYARYKRDQSHQEHGSKLKKAILDFGGRRM